MEIENFIRYASDVGQEKNGHMVRLNSQLELRLHEVCRLDKVHLRQALQEEEITIEDKGGLVKDVPLRDRALIQKLYDNTSRGNKGFIQAYPIPRPNYNDISPIVIWR